ncbi:Hypothetical protein (plasmid) [Pseudomonas putida]|nr:Hypothetical protein [Pseudomonas putida]QIZ22796.1 Hypothetical protein [Pseudomonas putida]
MVGVAAGAGQVVQHHHHGAAMAGQRAHQLEDFDLVAQV